jgi:hypothetical protein
MDRPGAEKSSRPVDEVLNGGFREANSIYRTSSLGRLLPDADKMAHRLVSNPLLPVGTVCLLVRRPSDPRFDE